MNTHFVAIKHKGFDKDGRGISAADGIKALLKAGIWPLFERTRCKNMVAPDGKVLAYAAGTGEGMVLAQAEIADVVQWNRRLAEKYPLLMDGVPDKVLILKNGQFLGSPVLVRDVIGKTSFAPQNLKKWGTCFMGGMRSLNERDFKILSGKG